MRTTKYLLSSGTSIVSEISESNGLLVSFTNDLGKAVKFDTFGEAMTEATKVNDLLGTPIFKAAIIVGNF